MRRIITAREQYEMLSPWRVAAVTQNMVDRLHNEFLDWHTKARLRVTDPERGPTGDWDHIEQFLGDNYPAAYRNHQWGMEHAAPALDRNGKPAPVVYPGSDMGFPSGVGFPAYNDEPYETGPEAVAMHGYDPKEVAASMLLLHNKSHPLRGDLAQHDQDRLNAIFDKRVQMQDAYKQRQPVIASVIRYATLLWAGFDPSEVTKRLRNEFYDWHEQQPPHPDPVHGERIDNNALGHWPTVENFLKDKYPAAHRGFANGLEDAQTHLRDPDQTYHSPMHMDDDPDADESHFDYHPPEPYQTDPHTIKQLGYDPEEVAAGMVLLHNRAHSGRQDAYLDENKNQLVDIFNKRQKMQDAYNRGSMVTANRDGWLLRIAMADTAPWHPLITRSNGFTEGMGRHRFRPMTYDVRLPDGHPEAGKLLGRLEATKSPFGQEVYIDSITSHPDHRKKGIPQALMERVIADHPGYHINPGVTTEEGAGFVQRLMDTNPNSGVKLSPDWKLSPISEEGNQAYKEDIDDLWSKHAMRQVTG